MVPAESVYAVFEAKQTINAELVRYAQEKVQSVRKLYRTSLPIPHAGGTYPAKPPIQVLGGILTLESDWIPSLGDSLNSTLTQNNGSLNFGCIAAHGYFYYDEAKNKYEFINGCKPATSFLFKLISQLPLSGTVPMRDIMAYSKWLST